MASSILGRARPLLLARLAGAALTFAVPLVLARVLVPASYGTFKQGWLISQTLQLVLPLGLTQSLYYFVPRDRVSRDRYVAQTLWVTLGVGVLSAVLLLAGGPLVAARFQNPELSRNLPWVAAFTAFTLAGSSLDVAWNASGRTTAAALVRVATEGGRGAAMVAGAALTRSVSGVFAGIAVATGLRAAICAVVLFRAHGARFELSTLRRQLGYAIPFGLAFLLIVPQQQFHQYAVAAAVSTAAFAIYSVGTFQLPVVDVLYTPVSELLQIAIAESDGAGRPPRAGLQLFHEAVLQLSFAFVPLTGLLLVAGPDLVVFLFSPRYAASGPIFRLAVISVALAALPLDGVMRARAQNRFMLVLSAFKLALTLALVTAGLRLLGPRGALLGWIAAEALARAAMLARTARIFEVPLRRVLPARALLRQLTATAVASPAAWIALRMVPGPALIRLVACGLAFAAAYLGLSWARGWLPPGWVALFRTAGAAPSGSAQ